MWKYKKYLKLGNTEDPRDYYKLNRYYKAGWFNTHWGITSRRLSNKATFCTEYSIYTPIVKSTTATFSTEYKAYVAHVESTTATFSAEYKEV